MELKELPGEQHALLLYKLSELPHRDERARQLEKDLKAYLQQYQELLFDLENTIRAHFWKLRKISKELCPQGQGVAKLVRRAPRVRAGALCERIKQWKQ